MNISAVNNVQFTGRFKTPAAFRKGDYDVYFYKDQIKSYKKGKLHKKLVFNEIPLGGNELRIRDYSKSILRHISKESDCFDRKDCDIEDGIFIGEFTINKNSEGKIDRVSFYDSTNGKREVVVRDSKDLEKLREAFKFYNEYIKSFYKNNYFERKPYPVNLLG